MFNSIRGELLEPGGELIFADCPLDDLSRRHIAVLRDRKAEFPSAANKVAPFTLSGLFEGDHVLG